MRREHLEKGVQKYGELALMAGDEDQSSSSEDDEEAILLNPKLERKFLDTLAKIRTNDPTMKNLEGELFNDSDFEEDDQPLPKKKKDKPLTYKDMQRKDIMENRADSQDSSEEEPQQNLFMKRNRGQET